MTAPVDIAAAVELVETRLGNRGGGFAYREMTRDEEWLLLKAFKALADERRDVEQRTAEAIAAWIEGADLTKSDTRGHIVTGIRAGKWRTP